MDKYISKLVNQPLNGAQMMKIVDGKANISTINQLKKYKNIDEVLGRHGAVILLYELKKGYGHWVCLYKYDKNALFFFDPYGLKPDEQLLFGNYSKPYLTMLLNKSDYDVLYNTEDIQKLSKNVSTCGKFVALKLIFRNLDNREFLSLFLDNKHYDPDFWVSALMSFL